MLLIHPPLTKPCEPPAALAYLAAALSAHGLPCTLCDLNIEGFAHLFETARPEADTWSRRAHKHLAENIAALRTEETYRHPDRYRRAVADLNRLVETTGQGFGLQLSLANYQDQSRSPLSSLDLKQAADDFAANIFYPYFSARLDQLVAEDATGWVGFSLSYLSQALCTFAMIGYLRAHRPGLKIVLGGGLVTTWLRGPRWHNPFGALVDHLIGGEGEGPLLALLGRTRQATHLPPRYNQLRDNPYLSPGLVLPYSTSFGCFWKRCSFCPETAEDNPYRQVAPARAVADLQALAAATSPALIHLLDNAIPPATLEELADNPLPAPWYGFARFAPRLADLDFCRRLQESGCRMLKLGLESADQQVLDRMGKGIEVGLATRVLTCLKEAGIATYVYLLFGTPWETLSQAERTMRFVAEHSRAITFLNLAIFNLPLGSREVASLTVDDFYQGDLSIYGNFRHPQGWERGEVRRFLDQSFRRQPEIAAILKRDPPFFTSNHAPFLVHPRSRGG